MHSLFSSSTEAQGAALCRLSLTRKGLQDRNRLVLTSCLQVRSLPIVSALVLLPRRGFAVLASCLNKHFW